MVGGVRVAVFGAGEAREEILNAFSCVGWHSVGLTMTYGCPASS